MHPVDENLALEPLALPHDVPYTYTGPYSGCYHHAAGSIDKRHAYLLHDVVMSWQFGTALEIGSLNGASTAAFVEAANRKPSMKFCACEIGPRTSLFRVLANAKQENVFLTTLPSSVTLGLEGEFDFIFVDGAHDMDAVSIELEHILRRQPLCVMAHDTNATDAGLSRCEGAKHLADTLRKHPAYRGKCIEDAVRRRGEQTERGMFFATTDETLYQAARECFARWCPVLEAVAA